MGFSPQTLANALLKSIIETSPARFLLMKKVPAGGFLQTKPFRDWLKDQASVITSTEKRRVTVWSSINRDF